MCNSWDIGVLFINIVFKFSVSGILESNSQILCSTINSAVQLDLENNAKLHCQTKKENM